MTSEKAIRFRHPDYDSDVAQKLISSSMSHVDHDDDDHDHDDDDVDSGGDDDHDDGP